MFSEKKAETYCAWRHHDGGSARDRSARWSVSAGPHWLIWVTDFCQLSLRDKREVKCSLYSFIFVKIIILYSYDEHDTNCNGYNEN